MSMRKELNRSALAAAILMACAGLVQAETVATNAPTENANLPTDLAKSRPAPGDRLVGVWRNEIAIAPCSGGGTPTTVVNYNTFHRGGTLTEFNLSPPPSRSIGSGQWRDYGGGVFDVHFQFARFTATGAFDGMQDVQAGIEVDARGRRSTGVVRARVLNVDGTLRVELCGTLQGARVTLLPN